MKKFYFLTMFLFSALLINAQTMVTFSVDMNTEGASADGIFMAGDWSSEAFGVDDWQEPGSNMDAQLTDGDGDGIYTLTVSLPAGSYFFKYSNGNGWPNAEAGGGSDNYQADLSGCGGVDNGFGGYNRTVTVPDQAEFAVETYEFNSCNLILDVNDLSTISNVTIAPNPASNFTMVSYANPNNASHDIMVVSLTGQVVKQYANITDTNLRIETQNLSAGMYFVTFQNELGEVGSEKLIVQ